MRTRQILSVALLMVAGLASPGALHGQDKWDEAERRIRRLPPSAFVDMDAAVRRDLEARGCTVPQIWFGDEPHNVIRAHLADPRQVDWAVLCSREGKSQILIYWGGPIQCPELGEASPDRNWLQGVGEGAIGFSQQISAVDRSYIEERHRFYGGPKPPPIHHQGLNHAFVEKASGVLYCYQGRWLALQGAD